MRLFLLSLLFLSPFLSLSLLRSDGGELAVVARGEVQIGAVDKLVLLHVHSLRVGCLLPLLVDSPAWARAPKPYPLVCLLRGERCLGGSQALLFFLRGDVGVVGRRCLRLYVVP